jgi:hypothetical protein
MPFVFYACRSIRVGDEPIAGPELSNAVTAAVLEAAKLANQHTVWDGELTEVSKFLDGCTLVATNQYADVCESVMRLAARYTEYGVTPAKIRKGAKVLRAFALDAKKAGLPLIYWA